MKCWESGGQIARFVAATTHAPATQSQIAVNSIIGTKGVPAINPFELRPALTNSKLFVRDRNMCAYCGGHFHESELTREHIIPQGAQGRGSLDERGHRLQALQPPQGAAHARASAICPCFMHPTCPACGVFHLRNRRILADQMEFLNAYVPRSSRLLN